MFSRIKTNGSLPRDPSRKAFNLTLPVGNNYPQSPSQVRSPKVSPTTSFASNSRISDDVHSLTSSMTVSPCSLGSYSFTDGKNSSSTSPTSSTCTSFATSTPVPPANSKFINNSLSSRVPTPGNLGMSSQCANSPYENLIGKVDCDSTQDKLKVPLSPSGIRTTPEYHRKPILVNSCETTPNSNGRVPKPALLSSSINNSALIGDRQSKDKAHHPKSKLSVSFSNSVQEYYDGKDDDDETTDFSDDQGRNQNDSETSSDNGYDENDLDKVCVGPSNTTTNPVQVGCTNQLRINGTPTESHTTGESTRPSIARTISTEVQVHVQSGNKIDCSVDNISDSSCCFNESNNRDGSDRRTLSSHNHNDSHGQTNLVCSNIRVNGNEPPTESLSGRKETNGILKCRELNELGVIETAGCGSPLSNGGVRSSTKTTFGGDTGKCVVAVVPPVVVIGSTSLPSSTSVNQDLTQSSSSGTQTVCETGNVKVSSLTSLSAITSTCSPTTGGVGSGPGNLTTTSSSLGKVHVSQ